MYFVKLWITISAPNLTGETDRRKCYQQLFKLCFLAIFDKPAISATSNGLLTVSQYKTFVSGVMAASTASSLISTNVVLISNLGVKF
jgi:hypothetical protein